MSGKYQTQGLLQKLREKTKKEESCIDKLQDVIFAQAGRDAFGTLMGDSSGFSMHAYGDWDDAKKGLISRRLFDKLHIMQTPHGKIVTCDVTPGQKHDSPIFRKMWKRVPNGNGYVLLDADMMQKSTVK